MTGAEARCHTWSGSSTAISRAFPACCAFFLGIHAHDLKLVPSTTAYMRWGKGATHRLRFTKTGDPGLEEAYARHFVWQGKGPFHPPALKETRTNDHQP